MFVLLLLHKHIRTHMASSTSNRPLCKTCGKEFSVFICPGCHNNLCTEHAKEHRQELAQQLDKVILDHDQLKQAIVDQTSDPHSQPLMKQINEWEPQSIVKIREAAADARAQLLEVIGSHTTTVSEALGHLTQELIKARASDNFIETELKEWTEKLDRW